MSGSTMLMSLSTTGQMSGSAPVLAAATASFVANAQTASFVALAQSASNAVSAQTASYANVFTVGSTLTAQTLVVQTITSSVDFVTGSTRFGSTLGNTHQFTGSVNITGSISSNAINVFSNDSSTTPGSLVVSETSNTRQLLIGYNSGSNYGSIQAIHQGVGFRNLILNASGGNIGIGTVSPNVSGQSSSVSVLTVKGSTSWGGVEVQNNANVADGLLLGFYGFTNSGITGNSAAGMPAYIGSWLSGTSGADNGAEIRFYTKGNGGQTLQRMVIANNGNVGIGTITPGVSLDLSSKTDALRLTNGTTAQRPTAAAGQIRYNTSFNFLEYYDGSNWVPVVGQTSPGSSASNPAESANEIKNYNPNATNGLYWIRQVGTTPIQAYCVFTDYNGSAIQGGPWTVPFISNDANSNFSTNGPTAAATFLSKCQAIGIASPGRGMENTRTTTEVYGAWLAVKRALWNGYASFIENGTTGGGAVLRMPMININGTGGASDHRLVYNTSLGTHLPPNIDGDACNAGQLFCGWWAGTDISGWRVNNNAMPGPEDWDPSDTVNGSYSGNGLQSALTVCVYK